MVTIKLNFFIEKVFFVFLGRVFLAPFVKFLGFFSFPLSVSFFYLTRYLLFPPAEGPPVCLCWCTNISEEWILYRKTVNKIN